MEQSPALVTASVTVKLWLPFPTAEENVCVGFANVDVLFAPEAGSPKFQRYVKLLPVDVFVKKTVVFAHESFGEKVKPATG